MKQKALEKLVKNLLSADFDFYAPIKRGDKVFVAQINNLQEIDWSGQIPFNTYKSIFLPQKQNLLEIKNQQVKNPVVKNKKQIAWGMSILDLQAFSLFEHVFRNDFAYQKNRQNTFVVGYSTGLPDDYRKYKAFHANYEENILEHLMFDVFIEHQKNGNYILFTGSEKGQQLLEQNGIQDYQNIEFAGLVPEQGIDPKILANRKAVELGINHPIWDELAQICLACGKCSIHCPTCFCFDCKDEPDFDSVKKVRQWTSCFYPEFSKVAGNHKDLDSVKKKLYFWYYHKFVRIPEEFSYYGCVSCMRCYKVCPVAINIANVLKNLRTKELKNID